jgi:2-C-methyl-D-erythritol 4-phosphate cytidylyltransferase / 2-C-methyl-D-erythritol 2,4-cyclodiphosphate synthase
MLIVAAGLGARAGGDVPKQYQHIGGRPLLRRTLDAVLACPGLAGVRVAIQPAHRALYDAAVAGLDMPPPVAGGRVTRQESVFNGVRAFAHLADDDVLLVHDAARPLVTADEIGALVACLDTHPVATLCHPVRDSLRGPGGPLSRQGVVAVTTPQGFRYGLLRDAHAWALENTREFTDDASLVEAFGTPPHLVPGGAGNMKVTDAQDMAMAQKMFAEPRTATGFDVHAFGGPGPVILCGVEIPHDRGLVGHSDADAALHALTDALLGLTAAGDIGAHFPPSDPKWRGAASRIFVEKAMDILRTAGGRLVHIDLTIVAQAPKIGPHRDAMRAAVAGMTGLGIERVSVKATTTEGLGFPGRGEGLAAQATATALF